MQAHTYLITSPIFEKALHTHSDNQECNDAKFKEMISILKEENIEKGEYVT